MIQETKNETVMAGGAAAPAQGQRRAWVWGLLERWALACVVVAIALLFSFYGPSSEQFATVANWQNILGSEVIIAVAALAVVIPLTCGEFDLSIGSNVGLSSIIAAAVLSGGAPLVVGLLAGIATGTVVGVINGLLVTRAGVSSLISTLATTSLIAGFVSLYTSDQVILRDIPEAITDFGAARWAGVPAVACVVAVVAVAVYVILQHTPFGRYLTAAGVNPAAARLVGLDVRKLVFSSFVLCGALAGVAGVLLLARTGTGNPQVGPDYTLPALAAAFLGATAVRPGTFNVLGTLLGVLLVAISINGLVLVGASAWVQPTVEGATLIIAVALSTYISRRQSGRT